MIRFIALGGADDIGASCYYLLINGTGLLVDCGIHPRKKGLDSIPDFSKLEQLPLDAVLITHAHQDHIGALPFLIKKFPHVKIFATSQSKEIAALTLKNAVSIIKKQETENKDFVAYNYNEVELLVKSIRDFAYDEILELTGLKGAENVTASFHDAGHILGSASVFIESGGKKIFFTGDINLSHQSIMNGAALPKIKPDILVTESTYGSTESDNMKGWKEEGQRLAKFINRKINNGGSVFIPVFSLGKTQELLFLISQLIASGKITDVPIYTGGLGRKISNVYDKNRYLVRRLNPDDELKSIPQNDIKLPAFFNEIKKNPGIVLSSSGMVVEGTLSFDIIKYWVRQKNYGIAVVGYMDPDSPGYRVANLSIGEKFRLNNQSEEVINLAEVKKFFFNSHSLREELLTIVRRLKPDKIIIIHGEEESRDWMGFNILKLLPETKVFSPMNGNEIIL